MRILLIRHGDPDYEHDTLTEKGHKEAALLAETAEDLNVGDCYVSPLGRAQVTASYTLKKLGLTAETKDWLQEFPAQVDINQELNFRKPIRTARRKTDIFSRVFFGIWFRDIGQNTRNIWTKMVGGHLWQRNTVILFPCMIM